VGAVASKVANNYQSQKPRYIFSTMAAHKTNPKGLGKLLNHKFDQALSAHQKGQLSAAKAAYSDILKMQPHNPDAMHLLGLVYHHEKQNAQALKWISQAIDIAPQVPDFLSNRGLVYCALKEYDLALRDLDQAIKLRPNFAQAYSNKGMALLEKKEFRSAISSLEIALLFLPDFAEALYNLANAHMALKQYDQAIVNFNQAIALNPKFLDAIYNKGHAHFGLGQFNEALLAFDACHTPLARAEALISLHAAGRTEEFFQRLEARAGLDDENISIAAIAAFVANQTGRPSAHQFCPHPLDFLYTSQLSRHLHDTPAFIDSCIQELMTIQAEWEPLNKATHHGSQAQIDLFDDPTGLIQQLQSIIIRELENYRIQFAHSDCTFIKKWPKHLNITGWHVILKQQGYQSRHIHPSGWLSGVIYFQVPPTLGKNEGAIEFSLMGDTYQTTHTNTPTVLHTPQPGDMVFFPSSLHHRTIPFTTDTNRIIVAFDLLPDLSP
jgi:tetratricopeptide (TPR) repeat protein